MLVSSVIFLPGESFAATGAESTSMTLNNSSPQIRVQIGNRRNRRGRGWNRGRHLGWQKHNRTRLVRQVYWMNGRRYVRYVRVRA
jgi:hypothetical protein